MLRKLWPNLIGICSLTALGMLGRLLPHPPNFTPIAAMALFSGFFFRSPMLAAVVPLVALVAGDLVIGAYDPRLMAVVYTSLLVPVVFRSVLQRRLSPMRLITCSLASSVIFFTATNVAVWGLGDWYPHTLAGVYSCIVAAIPFLRNTVCGDLVFSTAIFCTYVAVIRMRAAAQTACGTFAATA